MNIEIRSVSKSYGSLRALERVSLAIDPGQIVAVLGANGAGKTTLLRCLAGIVSPTRGEVWYDGQVLERENLELRRKLFFLPDTPVLLWHQTVLKNLALIIRLYQAEGSGVEDRVVRVLRDFDLLPAANGYVANLSRGQLYKTALSAMIVVDPELWVLDEPFASGMDAHGINAFKHYASEARQRGRTVIYSTQLLDLAERFSDRVCVVHEGQVRAFDAIAALRGGTGGAENVLEALFRRLREDG